MVITGTPGIGKSCFGFYLFIKSIQSGQPVALRIFNNTYIFLCEKLIAGEYAESYLWLNQEKILYLYDCGKHDTAPSRRFLNCKVAIFTSPDTAKYKDMVKRNDAIVLYMPLWTNVTTTTTLNQTAVEERYT